MFNSIGDRVKRFMAQKIKDAEEKHRLHCIQVDEEAKQKKDAFADELVAKIVGK